MKGRFGSIFKGETASRTLKVFGTLLLRLLLAPPGRWVEGGGGGFSVALHKMGTVYI